MTDIKPFGENIIALRVLFDDKAVWGRKVAMTKDHAVIEDSEGALWSCDPWLIVDELTTN